MGRAVGIKSKAGGGHRSSRAKIGGECSQAMSDWKTSGMTAAVAAILGKCRARAHAHKQAAAHEAAGNSLKAQALRHRAGKSVVGKEARLQRARELVAGRKAGRASSTTSKAVPSRSTPERQARAEGIKAGRIVLKGEDRASFTAAARQTRAERLGTMAKAKPPTPASKPSASSRSTPDRVAKARQLASLRRGDSESRFEARRQFQSDKSARQVAAASAAQKHVTPELDRRLDAAFLAANERNRGTNFVKLHDIRKALPDVPRAHLDAAIEKRRGAGGYSLEVHEGVVGKLTKSERRAGVPVAGRSDSQRYVYIQHGDVEGLRASHAKAKARAIAGRARG